MSRIRLPSRDLPFFFKEGSVIQLKILLKPLSRRESITLCSLHHCTFRCACAVHGVLRGTSALEPRHFPSRRLCGTRRRRSRSDPAFEAGSACCASPRGRQRSSGGDSLGDRPARGSSAPRASVRASVRSQTDARLSLPRLQLTAHSQLFLAPTLHPPLLNVTACAASQPYVRISSTARVPFTLRSIIPQLRYALPSTLYQLSCELPPAMAASVDLDRPMCLPHTHDPRSAIYGGRGRVRSIRVWFLRATARVPLSSTFSRACACTSSASLSRS